MASFYSCNDLLIFWTETFSPWLEDTSSGRNWYGKLDEMGEKLGECGYISAWCFQSISSLIWPGLQSRVTNPPYFTQSSWHRQMYFCWYFIGWNFSITYFTLLSCRRASKKSTCSTTAERPTQKNTSLSLVKRLIHEYYLVYGVFFFTHFSSL